MCDYCDCRSQPEIRDLSYEHEAILHVVAELRRSVSTPDGPRTAGLLDRLAELLVPHTRREEIGVFARLRSTIDAEYVEHLEHDHVAIDGLLELARHDAAAVDDLTTALSAHILVEESDLYPAARQVLGPDDWTAVDDAVRRDPTLVARLLPT